MSGWQAFLMQDFPALAAGLITSIACAVIGSFLVLRRMSLMGDAISHAVLPGIVGGFLLHVWLDRQGVHLNLPLVFFCGAVVIGVITAALSELVHRLGRVEPGASMGVVFTVLFALGVLMLSKIEHSTARGIHLDADCVLYGAMENVLWTTAPDSWGSLWSAHTWSGFPQSIVSMLIVAALDVAFVTLLFKELRITAFDPALAAAQGINPNVMHYLLMVFVAITTVAAFEAVGSILVVAMLIVPGVAAHLLTDRLSLLIPLSAVLASIASMSGYAVAARLDVNAAGMIGVMLGVMLALTALFAPRHGWLARRSGRLKSRLTTPAVHS